MGRRHVTLTAYISREFIFSFVVAFLFFFFIFFINNVLILAEDVLSKRVPTKDVLLLVVYTLPAVVSISFPFASLVGALMAVGRYASNNEVLAFQASGVSKKRIAIPFLVLGIIFAIVSFVMNDYFIPLGNLNFGRLYRKVLLTNPGLELESFSVKRYQDAIIITGSVDRNQISNLIIIDETSEKNKRIISASEASLTANSAQRGVISLQLKDVFSHTPESNKNKEYEYFESVKMDYNILLSDISVAISNPGPREMSSVDVYAVLVEKWAEQAIKEAQHRESVARSEYELSQWYRYGVELTAFGAMPQKQLLRNVETTNVEYLSMRDKTIRDRTTHTYELELHKKFSLPFSCFVFIIFAFPVGLYTKKSGRSVGFGIGLFVSILYYGMLFAGQNFGFRLSFSPFLSMWLPNFAILGLGMFFLILRRSTS